MFCADNTRVLRAIDLSRFSIFDFDAYGSPWVQAVILADRRRVARGAIRETATIPADSAPALDYFW
jgi:hypothetical protein